MEILSGNDVYYDLLVSGRGRSFHIIVGAHAYGNFICVPSMGIGCELSSLTDTFWNQESISRCLLNSYDSATLVAAIEQLSQI